ncbi:MAG: HAD-IIIC family phosphatase [Bacteroidales bacterium]|nr:HAD-IIIC family phosphatase [Bacteroidales bacterium]
MDKIKLVIWDLDETFWQGTLSEGTIKIVDDHVKIVKELTNRGIINSIVSKNNHEQVKEILTELNIWDYFIFPVIDWTPKGEAVKQIIHKCQLRPVNVLFLDDNRLNIEEVKFYNDGIHAFFPDYIKEMMQNPALAGNPDIEHTRLKQYKLLERKENEMGHFFDNISFLEQSEIQISFIENLPDINDRIYELIERTNQLNYTKIRLNREETDELLKNTGYEQKAVSVTDRYGDYGIVGYYCLDRTTHQLVHFIFSCRILNMGIEQYVYAKLNFPDIKVINDVSTALTDKKPYWIKEEKHQKIARKQKNKPGISILFKGGCDLSQLFHYIGSYHLDIIQETNYVGKNNLPIHNDHSQMILNSQLLDRADIKYIESSLPFFDSKSHQTQLFDNNYNILVFSILMDYTQDLYRHKEKGFLIPFGGYSYNLTDPSIHQDIARFFKEKKKEAISIDFLHQFSQEYEYVGQISESHFTENLTKIRQSISAHIPIIFINGSEVDDGFSAEKGSTQRHRDMNKSLESFIKGNSNCFLLDVRKYVKNREDVTNNIRHYQRLIYKDLASELMTILEKQLDLNLNYSIVNHVKTVFHKYISTNIEKAKRIIMRH